MMRRLIILRHAKSSWNSPAGTDHARPLNKRGIRTAPLVGDYLASEGWAPDVVLSSDSLRTQMTVAGVQQGLGTSPVVDFRGELYHAGIDAVRRVLPELGNEVETALVVGHNPGWEGVIEWLSGEFVMLKTADFGLLTGSGETWAEAVQTPRSWTLNALVTGRSLE